MLGKRDNSTLKQKKNTQSQLMLTVFAESPTC